MFIALHFAALGVPPEHGVMTGPTIDPVNMLHLPRFLIRIRLRAAAGVNVERIMTQCQLDIIGTGRTDAADAADIFQGLINRQHSGNAALGGHLIDDVRL